MPGSSFQPPRQRIAWIDCAKGLAILLIALHHATSYETAIFGFTGTKLVFSWRNVGLLFYHIRLPLFFFLSGVAASGFLSDRGPRLKWSAVRGYALVYVLWSAALLFVVPAWPDLVSPRAVPPEQFGGLAIGNSVVWYLWAILGCLLIAHLSRPLPGWAVIGGALTLHALFDAADVLPGHLPALERSLPFYLLGFRYPNLPDYLPGLPRGSVAGLAATTSAIWWSEFSPVLTEALLDLAGLGIGVFVARQLPGRWPSAVTPLAWIGRRTLPIYILHFPIIAAAGVTSAQFLAPLPPSNPLVSIYAPLLAGIAVGTSIVLHVLLARIGAGWLFSLGKPETSFPLVKGVA